MPLEIDILRDTLGFAKYILVVNTVLCLPAS